jgi:hypothetical protein
VLGVVVVAVELEVSDDELDEVSDELVLAAALGVAVAVAVSDVSVAPDELLELVDALGVALGVVVVVVVVELAAAALAVSLRASSPIDVAPTAATAVSPAVAIATRRRPRSLAFTLPPSDGPAHARRFPCLVTELGSGCCAWTVPRLSPALLQEGSAGRPVFTQTSHRQRTARQEPGAGW